MGRLRATLHLEARSIHLEADRTKFQAFCPIASEDFGPLTQQISLSKLASLLGAKQPLDEQCMEVGWIIVFSIQAPSTNQVHYNKQFSYLAQTMGHIICI